MANLGIRIKALAESVVINLAIVALWLMAEYDQFGELQFDRKCDSLIYCIYFFTITVMLVTIYMVEVRMKEKILKMIEERIEENERQQQYFKELDDSITARQFYFMAREAEAIYDLLDAELDE